MAIKGTHLIFITLLVILLFCFFYKGIEAFFVYFPDPHLDTTPADWHLEFEETWLNTEDKIKLHGWFISKAPMPQPPLAAVGKKSGQKENTPVILFCHGNAGNMSHRLDNIRLLLEYKLDVFIFDYRGYGKSAGEPSEAGLYLDAQAAYDFMVNKKHISPERIIIFGRSLGAAVAIDLSLKRKAKAVIIESGFTSTKEMAKTMPLFAIFAPLLPANFNNLEKITRITIPKLIIHGKEDEIIPFSMGQQLFQASQQPKYFFPIKGAGHNDTYIRGGKKYFETLATFTRNSKIKSNRPHVQISRR